MDTFRADSLLLSYRNVSVLCIIGGSSALAFGWIINAAVAMAFGGALVAAVIVSRIVHLSTPAVFVESRYRLAKSLGTLYLISATTLIIIYYSEGYRSVSVLSMLCILYLISISTVILSNSSTGLLMFIGTTLLHRSTIFFSSALLYGNDSLFHANVASETVEIGGIVSSAVAGKYSITAIYHIYVADVIHITGLSTQNASFIITLLYVLIPSIVVYTLSSRWFGQSTAALAVMLFTTSDYAIRWSLEPQATSFGFVFFVVGFFLFSRLVESNSLLYESLFILIGITITLTHQVSTFVFLFVISCIFAFRVLTSAQGVKVARMQPVVSLYLVVGFVWSMVEYQRLGNQLSFIQVLARNIARRIQFGNPDRVFLQPPAEMDVVIPGATNFPLLHTAGFGILLFLGALGGFSLLRRDQSPRITVFLLPTVGAMFAISFGSGLIMTLLQPTRWFQFTYIPLSILGGLGLLLSTTPIKRNYRRLLLISVLMLYVVLMGGAVPAGLDGVALQDTHHIREDRVTNSEYQVLHFAQSQSDNSRIVGDVHSSAVMTRHFGKDSTVFGWTLEGLRTQEGPQLLVERPQLYSGHARFFYVTDERAQKVTGNPPTAIEECGSQVVYSVGGSNTEPSRLHYMESRCRGSR